MLKKELNMCVCVCECVFHFIEQLEYSVTKRPNLVKSFNIEVFKNQVISNQTDQKCKNNKKHHKNSNVSILSFKLRPINNVLQNSKRERFG